MIASARRLPVQPPSLHVAQNMREEMLEAGRGEGMEKLIETTGALQDEVPDKPPG